MTRRFSQGAGAQVWGRSPEHWSCAHRLVRTPAGRARPLSPRLDCSDALSTVGLTLVEKSLVSGVVRVAALADLHCSKTSHGAFQPLFAKIAEEADVLLVAGDLTDY